jgi:hypothetical protein
LDVISDQRKAYKQIEKLLGDTKLTLENQLKSYKRHPLINAEDLVKSIGALLDAQIEELEKVRLRHPDLQRKDDIRESLTKLLDGKIGPPYSDDKLKDVYKEGHERYQKSKPPGFRDAKSKDGDRIFGDLVLWFQVIDKAASDKVPMIIVTDDVKEDWWWMHEGKIVGPNPELVAEIRCKAKVDFYMYVSDQFMEFARAYLKQDVDQEAINEIREVRRLDQLRRAQHQEMLLHTEHRVARLRNNCATLESELATLGSEISGLNNQLTRIAAEPTDSRTAALIASLSARIEQLEARRRSLDQRRNDMNHLLRIEIEKRNAAAHGSLERSRVVHMKDGSARRIVRRFPTTAVLSGLEAAEESIQETVQMDEKKGRQ